MKNFAAEWFDGESIKELVEILKDDLQRQTRGNHALSPIFCVIIILFRSMQAVKNVVKPDFGANLGLVNCGILYNQRLVIWGIRNLIVD